MVMNDAVRQQSRPTEWTITDLAGIHAVLTDERFGVPAADADTAPMGTVDWLRASVSRFCNGPEHWQRRALVAAELDRLDPAVLRASACSRAEAMLCRDGRAGGRDRRAGGRDRRTGGRDRPGQEELIAAVARHVPAAVLAERFGVADPDRCADAVADVAAAYFPGADEPARRAADAATRSLLEMLADAGTDAAVARTTAMVQGCDATASLIAAALALLPELPDDCSSDDLLAQTVYRSPPLRAIRRVALAPADLDGRAIATGDRVTCDIDAVRGGAAEPAADQPAAAALTFGYGARPCPGPEHALALAAGVIDAVRTATG